MSSKRIIRIRHVLHRRHQYNGNRGYERHGIVRLLSQHYTIGHHDFVRVFEGQLRGANCRRMSVQRAGPTLGRSRDGLHPGQVDRPVSLQGVGQRRVVRGQGCLSISHADQVVRGV